MHISDLVEERLRQHASEGTRLRRSLDDNASHALGEFDDWDGELERILNAGAVAWIPDYLALEPPDPGHGHTDLDLVFEVIPTAIKDRLALIATIRASRWSSPI
jgi:hypothetical protein